MRISKEKFVNLQRDGTTRMFAWGIAHGFTWTRQMVEMTPFEIGLTNFVSELEEKRKRELMGQGKEKPVAAALVPFNAVQPEITVSEHSR